MNASSASGLWPDLTVAMGRLLVAAKASRNSPARIARDDRVAIALGVDCRPTPTEVDGAVCVIGRDLHERGSPETRDRAALNRCR